MVRSRSWLWLALSLGAGCNAGSPGAAAEARTERANAPALGAGKTGSAPPASAPPAPAPAAAEPERDFRHAAPGRVIAVGDLHGDLSAARAALRLGGAIDGEDHWAGGDLTLVQTGDQIDRGDEDRDVLDLFARITEEARAAGGRVVALNGNHEIMNVQGDFRYVTPGAIETFAGVSPRSPLARGAGAPYAARAAAFLPGGAYAVQLAERDVVAVVGDSVFAHGGVLPEHVTYGIARLNAETRAWMRGSSSTGGPGLAPAIVASERGPDWVRDYALDPVSEATCEVLGRSLAALGVRRMVVGHTPQKTGISSACGERVYRIDVGLARFYGGPLQILQITPSGVEILKAAR